MTTTHERPISAASSAYLAAVGAALAGVPDSDRQELLDDLAEHLGELSHESDEGLVERLGPPAQYAAELLASAGIEASSRPAGTRFGVARRLRAAKALLDTTAGQRARAFALDLRPGWWILRAWLVLAALAVRGRGLQEALWLPNVIGNTLIDAGLLIGAIAVSIRIGRGPKWSSWLATGLGVLALFSVLTANRSYFYRVDDSGQSFPPGVLMSPSGREIDNIFAFDASGKPIDGVYLYDGAGIPLDVGNGTVLQENGVPFVSGLFPQPVLVGNDAGQIRVVQPKPPHVSIPRLPQPVTPTTAAKKATATTPTATTPTTAAAL